MKDEKIIQRMRDREPDSLRALMDRYIPYISSIVWNILRHYMTQEDAEEVVSDVFYTAWNQAEDLNADKLKAWLGAVARHKAKNKLREHTQNLPLEEDVLEIPDDAAFEQLERQEQQQLIRQAIHSLSETDRQIFLRHYYYAQTVSEISRIMRLPENTVKTRLRRGRMKLKEYLIGRDIYET